MSRSLMISAALLLASPMALAHNTEAGGLGQGLMHTFTGLDHLLSMVALGLWTATANRSVRLTVGLGLPLLLAIGLMLGMQTNLVAGADLAIALGLIMVGGLVASRVRFGQSRIMPVAGALGLSALFVMVNGVAHSEVFHAASEQPIAVFGLGLMISSLTLMMIGQMLGKLLAKQPELLRAAGALMACSGLALSIV
ncbi:MAG: HupE/UreJ family protein [Oceanobacter sp.]